MTLGDKNPFQELYVTDSPDPDVFVHLFSDIPVHHAPFLFAEGNVVLKGTQGSGKSMLLNLFRPTIRLAYSNAGIDFPVPIESRRFVGAGINLTKSGSYNFGQRLLTNSIEDDSKVYPLYFSDYVNYWIVRDIMESLTIAENHAELFGNIVNISKYPDFVRLLTTDDCWFGWLGECSDFESVKRRLTDRITNYRRFHNLNLDKIPDDMAESKTGIGEPVSKSVECLRLSEVISTDTPVFVRVDEVHRLYRSDVIRKELGVQYRRIINKALSTRDSLVSYRVGTRPYAWEDDLTVYGTEDKLENKRDYQVINLDSVLHRNEHQKAWIFPSFADDALRRRLDHAGYKRPARGKRPLVGLFGDGFSTDELAKTYVNNADPKRILKLDDSFSHSQLQFLQELFSSDPFESCLAAAWFRQKNQSDGVRANEALHDGSTPWNKIYWKKERVRQCLAQLAARNGQRMIWAGYNQITMLSSGNISIFLSISYEIWEAHLRNERSKSKEERLDPFEQNVPLPYDIQSVGIERASNAWFEKISELPRGDDRQQFIETLGTLFRKEIVEDKNMSYPGHTGFSIEKALLNEHPDLRSFLRDAVNYGALFEVPHTTKEKNRRPRIKWYLSPILCPHFQLPETRAKEPIYVRDIRQIAKWLRNAKIVSGDLQALIDLAPRREESESNIDASQMTLDLSDNQDS